MYSFRKGLLEQVDRWTPTSPKTYFPVLSDVVCDTLRICEAHRIPTSVPRALRRLVYSLSRLQTQSRFNNDVRKSKGAKNKQQQVDLHPYPTIGALHISHDTVPFDLYCKCLQIGLRLQFSRNDFCESWTALSHIYSFLGGHGLLGLMPVLHPHEQV